MILNNLLNLWLLFYTNLYTISLLEMSYAQIAQYAQQHG